MFIPKYFVTSRQFYALPCEIQAPHHSPTGEKKTKKHIAAKKRVRVDAKNISTVSISNLTGEWKFAKVSGLPELRSAVIECGA